jgi:hypothetical protein
MGRSWWVAIVALLPAMVLVGCSSDDPGPTVSARPTPIGKLDVAKVRLVRGEFCDRVPDAAVRRALGDDAEADESWGNGDPVPGGTGSGDVGHELGCAWTGAAGAAARAWVFARPVTTSFATSLVRSAGRHKGCTAEQTRTFGTPAVLQTCTVAGGVQRLRRAGLFGDTWLTCEVTGSPADLRARVDPWCAAVVAALDAG